jgi:hypothetical protein
MNIIDMQFWGAIPFRADSVENGCQEREKSGKVADGGGEKSVSGREEKRRERGQKSGGRIEGGR